ncbi:MAG: hypothetical protein RL885_12280 [Planctomycetota bacterium]
MSRPPEASFDRQSAERLKGLLDRVDRLLERSELWAGARGQNLMQRLRMARDQVHNKLLKLARSNEVRTRAREELNSAYRELQGLVEAVPES